VQATENVDMNQVQAFFYRNYAIPFTPVNGCVCQTNGEITALAFLTWCTGWLKPIKIRDIKLMY